MTTESGYNSVVKVLPQHAQGPRSDTQNLKNKNKKQMNEHILTKKKFNPILLESHHKIETDGRQEELRTLTLIIKNELVPTLLIIPKENGRVLREAIVLFV